MLETLRRAGPPLDVMIRSPLAERRRVPERTDAKTCGSDVSMVDTDAPIGVTRYRPRVVVNR
jgi:hypothetical protein